MIFSVNLLRIGKEDIGLWLEGLHASPGLGRGVTSASFHTRGNVLVTITLFTSDVNGLKIPSK